MVSPVPKHLRTEEECRLIPAPLLDHVVDLDVDPRRGVAVSGSKAHRAKFAPGLATELVRLAGTLSLGDPMAGTGTLAWETGLPMALNDLDCGMERFLMPLQDRGCEVTFGPAAEIRWKREACVFSPPYYPRTDRRRPNAHDDEKRGPVVGFRDSYGCDHEAFIGNPGGADAILVYRRQMLEVYAALRATCERMVVVTKNWTRLGVEMRLDLDTILMCMEAGWRPVGRHGWCPPPSLWSRFNAARGGGVQVEDVLIFERSYPAGPKPFWAGDHVYRDV
jgi:hypothetical protein